MASTLLFLLYLRIPLFGMVGGVLAAFPPLYYTLSRNPWVGGGIVGLTAAAFIPITGGVGVPLFFLFQCGLPGALLGFFLSRGKGGRISLVGGVGLTFSLMVAVTIGYTISQGVDPHTLVRSVIEKSITQGLDALKSSGMPEKDMAAIREGIRDLQRVIVTVYPAMILVWITFVTGFNLLILSQIRDRLPTPPELGRLARFRNPDHLVWVLIAAGFSLLVDHPLVHGVALNVLIVVCTAYFVQGIAVVTGIFDRFSVPPIMRSILYFIVILQPYLVLGLAILGIFDIWGDFRSPRQPKNL